MPDLIPNSIVKKLRADIRPERRIGQAGEGLYYYDGRRCHTAPLVLNAVVTNEKGQCTDSRSSKVTRNYLWPVPFFAIQDNPALTQTPVLAGNINRQSEDKCSSFYTRKL